MANTQLPTLRWGIIGCGQISSWFVADICLSERPGMQTRHVVQAVGSSSERKGSSFVAQHCPSQQPRIYDSYHGVYNDLDVDIVYIGTPHALHRQNALDAIAAGKHVLCEKPIAMNVKDAKVIEYAAREKGVFFMEAVWTRFFPITEKPHSLLHEDKVIGDISAAFVEFGLNMPISKADAGVRTASKALGAGALLDIGIYSLTWAALALDRSPQRKADISPDLTASMIFSGAAAEDNQVDEQVTVVLYYPDIKAQAICTASLLYKGREEFARNQGSKGSIAIGGVAASKPGYLIVRKDGEEEERFDFDVAGFGFHYEADAVAADIRAGRRENSRCSWKDTMTIMSRMDKARSICGLKYTQDE